MKNQITQTLKGFRDFLPTEKRKRDYIQNKIIETFEIFGFEPLQTPTLEYAELLMGKYGEEADRLVYNFEDRGGRKVAMPYDQTVPTARVLAQYQNQLGKYFKRYSIKNVFRAEKPQGGRYREFTQCDIDIFGTNNPISDAEILACTYQSFKNIGFEQVILKINDRQVLINSLEKFTTEKVDVFSIIQSIDKLDKLPVEKVVSELTSKGLEQTKAIQALDTIQKANISQNLDQIVKNAQFLGIPEENLQFTSTLARGLDYYTGMIFEVVIPEYSSGSCGGGGRYDKLIEQLGGINIPAVGIAFGFDRIVEAADSLNLIPTTNLGAKVLVTFLDEKFEGTTLQIVAKLRQDKVKTELYPNADKISKQFKYAEQKSIPWIVIIGEEEANQNKIALKNLKTGQQELLTIEQGIEKINNIE